MRWLARVHSIDHRIGRLVVAWISETVLRLSETWVRNRCHHANVEETGRSRRRNSNSFNNNKSLALQDGCRANTHEDRMRLRMTPPCVENRRAHIIVTQYRRHCLLAMIIHLFRNITVDFRKLELQGKLKKVRLVIRS